MKNNISLLYLTEDELVFDGEYRWVMTTEVM